MPIEIAAGESFTFDVIVRPFASGDSSFEFNMFIEANNLLYIQPVKTGITVLPAAEQETGQGEAGQKKAGREEGSAADGQTDGNSDSL